MEWFWIQTLGFIALLFSLVAYALNNDNQTKYCLSLSALFFSIQYAYLDAYSVAVVQGINTIRCILAIKTSSTGILLTLYVLYWSIGILFYKSPIDILPMIATTISSFALFKLKDIPMRTVMIIPSLIWLLISIINNSYGGTLLSIAFLAINLVTIHKSIKQTKDPVKTT